jgi:hypothetical protein
MCQDPPVCFWLHQISDDGKDRAAVHDISVANSVTFDRIVPRDNWIVHLPLESVTRRLRLVMTVMPLCVCVDEEDVYESTDDGTGR